MIEIIEVLRQEHRNIEKLLRVLERELSVFDRGDRPDYEVVLAVIDYFKDYPDSCHHPKEDIIVTKFRARDPVAAATIGDLEAQHREGASRLRRVAQAVERVLSDQDLLIERGHGDNRYAREHHEIITRFGRFPHRNEALGRESTVEEASYLGELRPSS